MVVDPPLSFAQRAVATVSDGRLSWRRAGLDAHDVVGVERFDGFSVVAGLAQFDESAADVHGTHVGAHDWLSGVGKAEARAGCARNEANMRSVGTACALLMIKMWLT